MAAPDPAVVERQMYVDMHLKGVDDPSYSLADLRNLGGGGVNAYRAAIAAEADNIVGDPFYTKSEVDNSFAEVNSTLAGVNSSLALKVSKNELVVNVLDYGVVGNNVVDDSTAFEAAVAAALSGKRLLWVPPGLVGVRLTRTINARFIDVQFDSNIVIAQTSGPGIILGGAATNSNKRVLSWASVNNSTASPVNPSIQLIGIKHALIFAGTVDFVQFYADGGVVADASCGYNTIISTGGLITRLDLTGVNGSGWINDNHFFGGRYKNINIGGTYVHNGNVWYACTIETCAIVISAGSCNRWYSARAEGACTVSFSASTWNNYIENSYSSSPASILSSAPLVVSSDLGTENIVVSQAANTLRPVEILRIDKSTKAFNGTQELKGYGTNGNIVPGHKLVKCRTNNVDVFDTGIIPLEQAAESSSGILEANSRITRFEFASSHKIWRPKIWLYDANMQLLDPLAFSRIYPTGGLVGHASGFYYYGAVQSIGRWLITDSTAKYARIAASTSNGSGIPFEWVAIYAYVPMGQNNSIPELWRRSSLRSLFQAAIPTEGLAQQGEVIGAPTGRLTCIQRVDTTLTADAIAGATTISVASITNMASGDLIGILLSDGTTHWTTINGAPASLTVTLTAAIPAAGALNGGLVGTNRWLLIV